MPTGAAELMKGTILDADSFDRGDLDTAALESALDQWTHHRSTQSHEVAERIAGCEVVITNKVIIDAAAMQSDAKVVSWMSSCCDELSSESDACTPTL